MAQKRCLLIIFALFPIDLEEARHLEDTLNTDFSFFVGTWHDCLHTTLITFDGEPAEKHIVDKVGCEGGELGTVSNVGNYQQTLQFVSSIVVEAQL